MAPVMISTVAPTTATPRRKNRSPDVSPGEITRGRSSTGAPGLSSSAVVEVMVSSPEPAVDVVRGALVKGGAEDLLGGAGLDDHPRGPLRCQEERAPLRDPCRLLHVVSDDDNRDQLTQLVDRLFNPT